MSLHTPKFKFAWLFQNIPKVHPQFKLVRRVRLATITGAGHCCYYTLLFFEGHGAYALMGGPLAILMIIEILRGGEH